VPGTGVEIPLRESIGISRDPTGSRRTSLTWARFELDTERLRASEGPKKTKTFYVNLDVRFKSIALSYDVNDIGEYSTRITMNLKISTRVY
jgi:hypothetical protein